MATNAAGFSLGLILALCAVNLNAETCNDVAALDFRNRTISAVRYTGKPDYGLFNGPAEGGPLRFRHGVFLQWDLPPDQYDTALERQEPRKKPDWKTTIEQDLLISPPGSNRVRILVVGQEHLTGTGSFTYVFGFQCASGQLKKIFEASGEGVKLHGAAATAIELDVGVWGTGDSHCCPSRTEQVRYDWSPSQKKFIRQGSKSALFWLP